MPSAGSGGAAGAVSHLGLPSWQVNDVPFRNLTREEAVQFLLGLPPGEEVTLVTQRKQDSECVCGPEGWGPVAAPGAHRASPVRSLPENGAVPSGRLFLHPHAL